MKYKAKNFHPGKYIKDIIDENEKSGLGTIFSAAREIGITVPELREIIAGKRDINNQLAIGLHRWTGTSTALWKRLQTSYNVHLIMGK